MTPSERKEIESIIIDLQKQLDEDLIRQSKDKLKYISMKYLKKCYKNICDNFVTYARIVAIENTEEVYVLWFDLPLIKKCNITETSIFTIDKIGLVTISEWEEVDDTEFWSAYNEVAYQFRMYISKGDFNTD